MDLKHRLQSAAPINPDYLKIPENLNPNNPESPEMSQSQNPQKPSGIPEFLKQMPEWTNPANDIPESPINQGQPSPEYSEFSNLPTTTAKSFISTSDFYERFELVFEILELMAPTLVGLELERISIQPHEAKKAKAASDVFYEICCKRKLFQWLVIEDDGLFGDVTKISIFAKAKWKTIKTEIAEKVEAAKAERGAAGKPDDFTGTTIEGEYVYADEIKKDNKQ